MIKANELRIGNLLFADEEILKLSEIKQGYAKEPYDLCMEYESGMFGDFNIEECAPIPLTEEWLLRFGFEQGFNTVPYFFKKDFYLQIYTYNAPAFHLKCCHCGVIHNTINYVHQLQNLYFALTNNELILK